MKTEETYEEYQSKVGEQGVRKVFKVLGNLELVKIPENKKKRTPDYEVKNSKGELVAFCEVKSLVDSNIPDFDKEESFEELMELSKKRDRNHRSKLKNHLSTANSQLEKYRYLPTILVFASFDMTDSMDMGQVLQDHVEIYPGEVIPDISILMKIHQKVVPSKVFTINSSISAMHNSDRGIEFGQLYFDTNEVLKRVGVLPLTFELD